MGLSIDREKVIRSLKIAISDERSTKFGGYGFVRLGIEEADIILNMLKEQEPKQKVSEWLEDSDPGQEYGTTWACRKCMHSIHKPYIWNPYDSGYKYCPHCGAMMEARLDD